MADIVNLRQRRKQKAREDTAMAAAAKRAAFGRTKAEKQAGVAERDRDRRKLDGLRRERQDGDGDAP